MNLITPGGPLIFKGGYHARVQKHRKRVVFQGGASTAWAILRVSKTAKIKKKGIFFKANKKIRDKGMFFTYYKHGIRV